MTLTIIITLVGIVLFGLLIWALSRNAIVVAEREERKYRKWRESHAKREKEEPDEDSGDPE